MCMHVLCRCILHYTRIYSGHLCIFQYNIGSARSIPTWAVFVSQGIELWTTFEENFCKLSCKNLPFIACRMCERCFMLAMFEVMWVKQEETMPQITINRWYKQVPNGWLILVFTTLDPIALNLPFAFSTRVLSASRHGSAMYGCV